MQATNGGRADFEYVAGRTSAPSTRPVPTMIRGSAAHRARRRPGERGRKTSAETAESYIDGLMRAFILFETAQFGLQGKALPNPLRNFHAEDCRLLSITNGFSPGTKNSNWKTQSRPNCADANMTCAPEGFATGRPISQLDGSTAEPTFRPPKRCSAKPPGSGSSRPLQAVHGSFPKNRAHARQVPPRHDIRWHRSATSSVDCSIRECGQFGERRSQTAGIPSATAPAMRRPQQRHRAVG